MGTAKCGLTRTTSPPDRVRGVYKIRQHKALAITRTALMTAPT